MSTIVFLELRLFRNSMIETYQINQLEQLGHQVEIWHLGELFWMSKNIRLNAPAIMGYMVKISSFNDLRNKVKQLDKNSVLFSMLGLLYYYPILYKIIKERDDLIWVGRLTKRLPRASKKQNLFQATINSAKAVLGSVFFFKLYRPISNVFIFFAQKIIRKYGYMFGILSYQTDYLMVRNMKQVPPSYPKDKVLVTHADDYNVHLLYRDIELDPSLQDAIVFLDQMIYHHPDFETLGKDMMNEEAYYQKLNKVLDDISEKSGKKVIIAGHPEAEKQPSYAKRFEGKKFIIGKSVALVKYASLVLTHYSNAVNFAVIYNKPLLLLSNNGFKRFDKIMRPIQVLSKELNSPIVNMDDYNLQNINLDYKPNYIAYRNNYIKSDNTPEELSYPYAVNYVLNRIKSDQAKA